MTETIELRFRVILQEHADGRVSACFVAFPNVRAQASSRNAAIEAARAQLTTFLGGPGATAFESYVFPETQEARLLSVDLLPANHTSANPIPVAVLVLLTPWESPSSRVYLVTAPRVVGFQVLVSLDGSSEEEIERLDAADDDLIREKIVAALRRHTQGWNTEAILRIDQVRSFAIETITAAVPDPSPAPPASEKPPNPASQPNVLQLCGVNLSGGPSGKPTSRAYGRNALIGRLMANLDLGPRYSVLLVGPPGVGKTVLVDELVARIRNGNVPPSLKGREVWSVTANNLIAGMRFTGEWQGRIQALINLVRKGRQIIFMADPGQIADAGRWSQSDNNMSRFLRPYVESGEIVIICETTDEGYAATHRQEPSFIDAFTRIDVPETSEADTAEILQAVARRIESRYTVTVDSTAITSAYDLTRRFRSDQAFPGKAIRLLEEAVVAAQRESTNASDAVIVGRRQVISHFSASTGTAEVLLSDERVLPPDEVRGFFAARLLGQPEAIEAVVDLISAIKAGLTDPAKPLGSFVFLGPTGVGKTELAKILAEFLFGDRDRLLRFDMSEYQELYTVSRLIGAPPGYVGHLEAGQLTEAVRRRPFSVVLLDEIEKAHRGVQDALLSVLGEGRLTDGAGRTADFHNTIVIMTSNLGASRRELEPMGFGRGDSRTVDGVDGAHAHFVAEAERFFRPEFFNRIDRIVAFRPLDRETVRRIIRRELGKLLLRDGIVRRGLAVEVDEALLEHIAEEGFHPLYGARPIQRTIERLVIAPLARRLVSEAPRPGQVLGLGLRDGKVHLSLLSHTDEGQDALPLLDVQVHDRPLTRSGFLRDTPDGRGSRSNVDGSNSDTAPAR